MPHNTDVYPFVVLGDGMVDEERMVRALKFVRKTPYPVPIFQFAKTIEKARELADRMKPWNESVLICKIEEVIK